MAANSNYDITFAPCRLQIRPLLVNHHQLGFFCYNKIDLLQIPKFYEISNFVRNKADNL